MTKRGSSFIFDQSDPAIRNDLNMIVHQYLLEQQFFSAAKAVESELSQRLIDVVTKRSQVLLLRNRLCRGEWDDAHLLLAKLVPRKDIRRFLYHLNKLEFLELIEMSQQRQALVFLQTHLKPFEDIACNQRKDEFKELCYLLSCKSLADSEVYRPFSHFMRQREIAAEEICDSLSLYLQLPSLEIISAPATSSGDKVKSEVDGEGQVGAREVPARGRLITLLQQAFAYQILMKSELKLPRDLGPDTDPDPPADSGDVTTATALITPATAFERQMPVTTAISLAMPSKRESSDSCVTVHRLIEDYTVAVVPSRPMAVLKAQLVQPGQSQEEGSGQRRNLGDIKCLAMTAASAGAALVTSSDGLSGSSGLSDPGQDSDGEGSVTVVAGTDRGSLLLWRLPAKYSHTKKDGGTSTAPEVLYKGENDHVFDISQEGFSDCVLAPSAVLQLRKGDNVRVRRTYRGDDDDDSGLFPPKIRAVAASSSTGSLAWSHSSSSVSSSVLVAAGLSDGTIALVCAGYQAIEDSHKDLPSSRHIYNSARYRGGDNSSNSHKGINTNTDSKLRDRNSSRSRPGRLPFEPRQPMTFSQKRSYLETHEGDVFSVSFHPEGRHLASGGQDRTVAVHDVVAATCIKQFEGHNAAVTHVTYNKLGNLVVSSSKDGTVKFWDILSGLCVKTIAPTLLARSSSSYVGSCQRFPKRTVPTQDVRTPSFLTSSSSLSFLSSSSSSFSSSWDQSGGEILSTALSDDGRYLLVTPRLSSTRLLDLRMGSVHSLFPHSPQSSSSGSVSSDCQSDPRGRVICRSNLQQRDGEREGDSNALSRKLSLSYQSSNYLPRRASNVLFQQATFCCSGSVVALGLSSDGRVPGPVATVGLWSAHTGQLMRTLSICCGTRTSTANKTVYSPDVPNKCNIAVRTGALMTNIGNDTKEDRERDRDSNSCPDESNPSVENCVLEKEEGVSNFQRGLQTESHSYNTTMNINMNDRRSYLELLADSPVFATIYDAQSGILASASAAGITLWV